MLNSVKEALRLLSDDFNEEVSSLIDAAKRDLETTGIKVDEDDPLVKMAIIVYCKANFGWDNNESEKLNASYEMLKTKMALTSAYNGGEQA